MDDTHVSHERKKNHDSSTNVRETKIASFALHRCVQRTFKIFK